VHGGGGALDPRFESVPFGELDQAHAKAWAFWLTGGALAPRGAAGTDDSGVSGLIVYRSGDPALSGSMARPKGPTRTLGVTVAGLPQTLKHSVPLD